MVMVSSIGQDQIKKILAGSSKPTITAPLIGQLKIPIPNKEQLQQSKSLFAKAEFVRKNSHEIIVAVQELFDNRFRGVVTPKSVSYQIAKSLLVKRWDPHYHNPSFQNMRDYIGQKQVEKGPT